MSELRQQIAQMLIMGFSGCEVDQQSPIVSSIQNDGIAGVLLFDYDLQAQRYGKNLQTIDQIKRLTQQLSTFSQDANQPPLLIAVDYEGGAVDRFTNINGCIKTYKASELALLDEETRFHEMLNMATQLKNLGFNLNFAPVVDLNLNSQTGIIGKKGRSFATDPTTVIHIAKQFVTAFYECGIICAYKHFPGHGSAALDTHEGFVDVTDDFSWDELIPYQQLLSPSCPPVMIMTAHVINRKLEKQGIPATLSAPILTDLLRGQLGFDGVIVSDDLQMRAISEHYSLEQAVGLTINAGADMLIFANQLGTITVKEIIDCIEAQVHSGNIPIERIKQSYQRVLKLKSTMLKSAPRHSEHSMLS